MKRKKRNAYVLLTLGAVKIIVDVALALAIAGMLVLFGLEFPHPTKWDSLWPIRILHAWGDPALAWVADRFSWMWPSKEISLLPIGAGFVLLAIKQGLDAAIVRISKYIEKRLPLPSEAEELSSAASSMGISVSSTLLALAAVSDKARIKIQRRHARVGRLLREAKRRSCAFLSIDVVDAVKMKEGADQERVTRSFKAYGDMIEEVFRLSSAWKEAWTTDGVMGCFQDVPHALDAAKDVLRRLKALNASGNELSLPFRVRCGLNEGELVIFEDSKLEKVADHVIDVAGHMQKKARPNSLWLSSELYDQIEDKTGFHPANAKVDGLAVQEWRA